MSDRRRRTAGPTGFSTTGTRTALGYWIPLAVTVTAATIALAAWVWSERSDSIDDENDDARDKDRNRDGPITLEDTTDDTTTDDDARGHPDNASVLARVHSALRRTPSPQQIFDGASRRVVAGVTAAGAAFGGALGAIHEEGNGDFEDHSRWAEPTPPTVLEGARGGGFGASSGLRTQAPKTRQSVAIVVSAVPDTKEDLSEHASILSRLPEYVDPAASKVFVLIYSPGAQPPSSENPSSSHPTLSVASSYDNIAREEAESPDSDMASIEPQPAQDDAESSLFKALHSQAQVLVDKDTMIMPFNTPNGHVHILRHLSPDIVYVQDSLTGETGEAVQNISGWIRQVVIITTGPETEENWWKQEGAIGRRTAVVDVAGVGEDWRVRMSHD